MIDLFTRDCKCSRSVICCCVTLYIYLFFGIIQKGLWTNFVFYADFPSEPNPYVEQALDSLIDPVVAGVSKLRTTSQISAISMSVNAMCEAWTAHILKQKMRFRSVLLQLSKAAAFYVYFEDNKI